MSCVVEINSDTRTLAPVVRNPRMACQAGDTLRIRAYRFNDFLVEQLCDVRLPVHQVNPTGDEVSNVLLCTYSGRVLDPVRTGPMGARVFAQPQ